MQEPYPAMRPITEMQNAPIRGVLHSSFQTRLGVLSPLLQTRLAAKFGIRWHIPTSTHLCRILAGKQIRKPAIPGKNLQPL